MTLHKQRNFKDPQYVKWRKAVYARDNSSCRMCGRHGRGAHLQAHHIVRWADSPELRYVISNGITLCEVCHSLVKDREAEYAPRFVALISQAPKRKRDRDSFIAVRIALRKEKDNV